MGKNTKDILITGASGFIGNNLLEFLSKKKKFKIFAVYNQNKPKINYKSIRFIKFNFLKDNIKKLPKKIDSIIHLAGIRNTFLKKSRGNKQITVNKKICRKLIDYSNYSKCKNLIFISSVYVYSSLTPKKNRLVKMISIKPQDYLGLSKFYCEKILIKNFLNSFKKKLIILRLFTAYGRFSSREQFLPATIRKFNSAKINKLEFFDSDIKRDFINIADVCSAIYKSVIYTNKMKQSYEIFDLGFGKSVKITNIIKMLSNFFNFKNKRVIFSKEKSNKKGDKDHFANISKTCEKLNWKPKININLGLKQYINNFH